jgi:hypothetical protein
MFSNTSDEMLVLKEKRLQALKLQQEQPRRQQPGPMTTMTIWILVVLMRMQNLRLFLKTSIRPQTDLSMNFSWF